jgi:(1->4)-alpha-D-glucan 1-alpha-D-glucosylmutase
MNEVSAVQHEHANADNFASLWADISGRSAKFEDEENEARHEILHATFGSALRAAAASFHTISDGQAGRQSDFESALGSLLQNFRAYRTYATGDNADPTPGPFFEAALATALISSTEPEKNALLSIADTMRGKKASWGEAARDAVRRFNQLAAPVAAKAVEDTAFYRYGRLLSRNDVGFYPGCFAIKQEMFLQSAIDRAAQFPNAMLATATHDHKRGEDARARLAALSEIPEIWKEEVAAWFGLNASLRGHRVTAGDEYQLYQTLVGCWPIAGTESAFDELPVFTNRILEWREKSLREAKLQTSWSSGDLEFEQQNVDFVRAILEPSRSMVFLNRLARFVSRLAPAGVLNSLTQCTLRYSCPGLPDLFQGTELWDFSLVDPDNRRPVDFDARQRHLTESRALALESWQTGAVKLALIRQLLSLRKDNPDLFEAAPLQPIEASGPCTRNVLAFSRTIGDKVLIVAVSRLCAQSCLLSGMPLPAASFWGNTEIMPDAKSKNRGWRNALDPAAIATTNFDCASLFAKLPVSVLVSDRP